MSKTAEVNSGGHAASGGTAAHVQPETRQQLSAVAASVAHRAAVNKGTGQKTIQPSVWPAVRRTKCRGNRGPWSLLQAGGVKNCLTIIQRREAGSLRILEQRSGSPASRRKTYALNRPKRNLRATLQFLQSPAARD